MVIKKCRVCGGEFFKPSLLRYENMPAKAQFLPRANSLKNDRGINLEVYQCSACGLVQLSNEPPTYYRDVIRASAYSPEMKIFRRQQFSRFLRNYGLKGKKIIEIGCGRGEYLSLMGSLGVRAFGLEHLAASVEHCRKNGLRVEKGFVNKSTIRFSKAPFAAFFILSYLEHLPDPNSILRGIASNLTKEGVGLVEVPNFNMILKRKLFSEFMRDHLFYFTKESLTGLLKYNGFEVIKVEQIWHDYLLSAVVRKRSKLDLTSFRQKQKQLKKVIRVYLDRFGAKNVAIWGAGHQALAVIALANLSERIKYVIDSAPFKQGRFTPATHLPIVSPETLNADPVEAVIVMAASYSDEVAQIIRQKYNPEIKVSILRDFGLEEVK